MQVTLDKIYPMPCNADTAWKFLQDIEAVAECMPGASITERINDKSYKGAVSVRLGPASMSFKGQITVVSIDAATQTLHLIGKGTDTTGTSGASMDLLATVRAAGEQCELVGKSSITMNGKAAAFGGRMMDSVSEQILKQFAANFAQRVSEMQAQGQSNMAAAESDDANDHAPPARGAKAASKPQELNGLTLLWAVVADWFRRLFTRKPV
ncbi:MAG TPA: SRPBCC family protein [Pusillimonas sp.]|uniref:SRPBCC family protein n=1 Tax=Pusillimonas sp. TaxID=3040095 RepID=UPI002BCDD115|nr:SRPBCC family protein [Pusillimonas sp.]HUH88089.1 SRPBCC family protein [Pusillimonas sp.]